MLLYGFSLVVEITVRGKKQQVHMFIVDFLSLKISVKVAMLNNYEYSAPPKNGGAEHFDL